MLAAIYVYIQWIVGLIFIILYAVTTISVILVIVAENRNPLKTISWVIVLLLAPGIGLLVYCFLGQDNRKLRVISRRAYKRIMISNEANGSSNFGSGHLLDDLIYYVYSGENCRLIMMGDVAQLPPVMQTESPALDVQTLAKYNLDVEEILLTQVVRQSEDSGILYNATRLRDALRNNSVEIYPTLRLDDYPDIKKVSGEDLIEEITSAYNRDGIEETM